jgi:hypothetical protein
MKCNIEYRKHDVDSTLKVLDRQNGYLRTRIRPWPQSFDSLHQDHVSLIVLSQLLLDAEQPNFTGCYVFTES